jgi:hypothetical protein
MLDHTIIEYASSIRWRGSARHGSGDKHPLLAQSGQKVWSAS